MVATIHEFQHPCAVLLFELGSMSLKDAFDLDVTTGVMQERRRMVASYGLDAARGMAFLHESGIAHLDLKPENVLIGPADTPWITDFGLSTSANMTSMSQSSAAAAGWARSCLT